MLMDVAYGIILIEFFSLAYTAIISPPPQQSLTLERQCPLISICNANDSLILQLLL